LQEKSGNDRVGDTVEESCAEIARRVTAAEIKTLSALADAMRKIVPTDVEFEASFSTARVSNSNLARYYLRALELKKKRNAEPEWIPNEDIVINLEHVLPESPGGNWPSFDDDSAQLYYNRIGNMVLLQASQNSLIGNSAFADKKPILKKSTFILTEQVGDKPKWEKDDINERQKQLAALAVETWPLS
jgi:hypothetical protein